VDTAVRLYMLVYASVIKNSVIKNEDAGFFFRNIISNYPATQRHTPEDRNPELRRSKNVINKNTQLGGTKCNVFVQICTVFNQFYVSYVCYATSLCRSE